MSLRVYETLEQRTPEWHEARRGIVTASVVGKLITGKTLKPADNDVSRGVTATLVAERISGHVEDTYVSSDMFRGIEMEPFARDEYAQHYAPVTEVGFMVRDFGLSLPEYSIGYSPDGLVGDDGLIEIKCPRPKNHLATILSGQVPAQYMAQLQCGLVVSGRDWIDYVSYVGGMPLFVKRVHLEPRWHRAIVSAVSVFEDTAAEMVARYQAATADLPMTERIALDIEEIRI